MCCYTIWFIYSCNHLSTCKSCICMNIHSLQISIQQETIVMLESSLQPEMFVFIQYLYLSVYLYVHISTHPSVVKFSEQKFMLPRIFLSTHWTLNISLSLGKTDLNSLICQILLVGQQTSDLTCKCLHLHENNFSSSYVYSGGKAEEWLNNVLLLHRCHSSKSTKYIWL